MLPCVSMDGHSPTHSERSRVLGLLRCHGWNATSFQILEGGFSYWFEGDTACVAYVDTGGAWVAAGAPIAAEGRLPEVARAFVAAARERGRSACFFATERRFIHAAGFAHLLIGEQPVWDPRAWPSTLQQAPRLREQLRRARAKAVHVARVEADEFARPGAPLRRSLERLIQTWQGSKAMPPMGFLVRVDPFEFADERRLFVARLGDDAAAPVIGFAAVVPVYARRGWFLEDLIRAPSAPNGTTELLVDAAMNDAAALGSDYLTLGLSPLAGDVPWSLGVARRYAGPLYDFGGLRAFKAKFRPQRWAPIYLTYPAGRAATRAVTATRALYESLRAFARRGLLRYGLETVLRGPDVVVRALALLLVPWTALLVMLDTASWFPAPWVKWGWVGFDLALCAALLMLGRRFRPWLSQVIVLAVTLDACLTLAQAVVFNLPRVHGYGAVLGVAVAVSAPAVASRILHNAHRRACRVWGH
jgi:phosphatidylglycerol lysyltransferase